MSPDRRRQATNPFREDVGQLADLLAQNHYCSYTEALAMPLADALIANARILHRLQRQADASSSRG